MRSWPNRLYQASISWDLKKKNKCIQHGEHTRAAAIITNSHIKRFLSGGNRWPTGPVAYHISRFDSRSQRPLPPSLSLFPVSLLSFHKSPKTNLKKEKEKRFLSKTEGSAHVNYLDGKLWTHKINGPTVYTSQ